MASYKIDFARSALKDLRRLDRTVVSRIIQSIESLAENPRPIGARKLVGSEYTYRIRIGSYRVIYSLDDELLIVGVQRIRHRQEAYD